MALTNSTLLVLGQLLKKGPMAPKEISKKAGVAPRTVSNALNELMDRDLCGKMPNLQDMRSPLYYANKDRIRERYGKPDVWLSQLTSRLKGI
jgi:DNA-binding MarR family transcriptional regulator